MSQPFTPEDQRLIDQARRLVDAVAPGSSAAQPRFKDASGQPTAPAAPAADAAPFAVRLAPGPVFDRARLWQPDPARAVWYDLPGGGGVWVLPLSGGERRQVNELVVAYLKRLYPEPAAGKTLSEREQEQRHLGTLFDQEILGRMAQAVVCCRKGSLATDERAFEDGDIEAFYVNPGWDEAAQEIGAICDTLGRGRSEAELLRETLRGFFGAMAKRLVSCASRLSSASSDGMPAPSVVAATRAALTSCATSLGSLTQPGAWERGELAAAAQAWESEEESGRD